MAHCDPTQRPQSQIVEFSSQAPQHTLLAPNGYGRQIEARLRPYQLKIEPAPQGAMLSGDALAVALGAAMIERALELQAAGRTDEARLARAIGEVLDYELKHDLSFRLVGLNNALRPMSLSQVAFMNALLHSRRELILGIGPTGTGKTHLAIAAGLNALALGRVKSLVATRPHVIFEGETITPSIRAETSDDDQLDPIHDELLSLLGHDEVQRLTQHGQLEILPLGRMRGRTFNDAFIVVDEAQNITVRKMRMVVTRLGRGSQMVLTGDPSHIELHEDEPSGLPHLLKLIAGANLALVHEFEGADIMRNDVVARLESLYARAAPLHAA